LIYTKDKEIVEGDVPKDEIIVETDFHRRDLDLNQKKSIEVLAQYEVVLSIARRGLFTCGQPYVKIKHQTKFGKACAKRVNDFSLKPPANQCL